VNDEKKIVTGFSERDLVKTNVPKLLQVVTHNRVLRHLVGAQVGNGQYAVARLSPTGDLFTTPTITQYTPRFDAHGDDEGSTPSDKVRWKSKYKMSIKKQLKFIYFYSYHVHNIIQVLVF
jgi:hypothetical protein